MDELTLTLYVYRISYMLIDLRPDPDTRAERKEGLLYGLGNKYGGLEGAVAAMTENYKRLGYRVACIKELDTYKVSAALSDLISQYSVSF